MDILVDTWLLLLFFFFAALPIGEYAAIALLAFFGFKSIKDAWQLPDNANGNLQGNSESGELAEAEELVKEKVVLFQNVDSMKSFGQSI